MDTHIHPDPGNTASGPLHVSLPEDVFDLGAGQIGTRRRPGAAGAVGVAGGAAFARGRTPPASSPWPVAWDGGLRAGSGRRCRLLLLDLQYRLSGAADGVDAAASGERGRHWTTGGSGAVGASGARQCAASAASRQARSVYPGAAEVRGGRDPRVESGCACWHFGRHPDPARSRGRAG